MPEQRARRGQTAHCAQDGLAHTGTRQEVLQAYAGNPLFRSLDLAVGSFAACRIGHGMSLIENQHAFEAVPCPCENLVEPRRVGPARPQGRINDVKDARPHPDRRAKFPGAKRLDVDGKAAECRPVTPGIFEQLSEQSTCLRRFPDQSSRFHR